MGHELRSCELGLTVSTSLAPVVGILGGFSTRRLVASEARSNKRVKTDAFKVVAQWWGIGAPPTRPTLGQTERGVRVRKSWGFGIVLLALLLSGCSEAGSSSPSVGSEASASASVAAEVTVASPARAPIGPGKVILKGGAPHQGQHLFLVVYASGADRSLVETRAFDVQSIFQTGAGPLVIDRTDHFDGLAPGSWIAFEAYSDRNLASEDASVTAEWLSYERIVPTIEPVVVRCSDSFPLSGEVLLRE